MVIKPLSFMNPAAIAALSGVMFQQYYAKARGTEAKRVLKALSRLVVDVRENGGDLSCQSLAMMVKTKDVSADELSNGARIMFSNKRPLPFNLPGVIGQMETMN